MTELTFFQDMQNAMNDQAVDVWEMIEHSRSSGYRLRLGEVSITEMNFYRLRKFFTNRVYLDTVEPDEKKTGADWEWIIGHGDKWIQIRVQAKIINKSGSFAELGHPPNVRGQQMDTLIDPIPGSTACRWMPLYVFYTATPPAPVINTAAPAPVIRGMIPRYGCSAKPAYAVKKVYGPSPRGRANLKSRDHLPEAIPWADIFNGLVKLLKAGKTLSSIVHGLADQSFPSDGKKIEDFWDASVSAGKCNGGLPAYIKAIVDPKNDEFRAAEVSRLIVKVRNDPNEQSEVEGESDARDQSELNKNAESHTVITSGSMETRGDSFPSIPSRTITIDSPTAGKKNASLPSFVSVIDIDLLPDMD